MDTNTNRAETSRARRQLIIEAAAHCFVKQGFHQTSVRDIATRAGISLGNLYNHFGNKSALIAEIATLEAQELDDILEQISKITDPAKALDRFVSLYLDYCCAPENIALSAEIVSEALRTSTVAAGFMQNRANLNAVIARLVAVIATAQTTKPQIKSTEITGFVIDLIEGLATRTAFDAREPTRTEIKSLKLAIQTLSGSLSPS